MATARWQVASRLELHSDADGATRGDGNRASADSSGSAAVRVDGDDAAVGDNIEGGTKRADASGGGGNATRVGNDNSEAQGGMEASAASRNGSAELAVASNEEGGVVNESSAPTAAETREPADDYSHETRLDAMFASDELFVAMRVVHERRGPGAIVEIREDSNEVVVRFDSGEQHEYTPHSLHKLWREVALHSQEGDVVAHAKPASMLERKDEEALKTYAMADVPSMLGRASRIRKTKQDGRHVTGAYHYIAVAEHALHMRNYEQACHEYDAALQVIEQSEVGSNSRLGAQVAHGLFSFTRPHVLSLHVLTNRQTL